MDGTIYIYIYISVQQGFPAGLDVNQFLASFNPLPPTDAAEALASSSPSANSSSSSTPVVVVGGAAAAEAKEETVGQSSGLRQTIIIQTPQGPLTISAASPGTEGENELPPVRRRRDYNKLRREVRDKLEKDLSDSPAP
jgi:hypothetical protein